MSITSELRTTDNCLITDATVCGIEISGQLAEDVRNYLEANNLTGPIITLPGAERREIHLVTNPNKAALALRALVDMGATLHLDGAAIPLPQQHRTAERARWAVAPTEARWIPPVVVLSAAIRAARATARTAAPAFATA